MYFRPHFHLNHYLYHHHPLVQSYPICTFESDPLHPLQPHPSRVEGNPRRIQMIEQEHGFFETIV